MEGFGLDRGGGVRSEGMELSSEGFKSGGWAEEVREVGGLGLMGLEEFGSRGRVGIGEVGVWG